MTYHCHYWPSSLSLRQCLSGFSTVKFYFFPYCERKSLCSAHTSEMRSYSPPPWRCSSDTNYLEFCMRNLPLLFHLFNHLFLSAWTYGYLFIFCSNDSSLGSWTLSWLVLLAFLWHIPNIVGFFSPRISFLSDTTRYTSLYSIFSVPVLESTLSLRSSAFFYLKSY